MMMMMMMMMMMIIVTQRRIVRSGHRQNLTLFSVMMRVMRVMIRNPDDDDESDVYDSDNQGFLRAS